jgi:hypothetical protein
MNGPFSTKTITVHANHDAPDRPVLRTPDDRGRCFCSSSCARITLRSGKAHTRLEAFISELTRADCSIRRPLSTHGIQCRDHRWRVQATPPAPGRRGVATQRRHTEIRDVASAWASFRKTFLLLESLSSPDGRGAAEPRVQTRTAACPPLRLQDLEYKPSSLRLA